MARISEIIGGLQIIARYTDKGEESHIDAQHDVVYAGPGVKKETVSEADRHRLDELRWHYDREADSWARFT